MNQIAAVIPTFKRIEALQKSLKHIYACQPAPAEVIIHVDAGDNETAQWLNLTHPDVIVISSAEPMGAGGGRNKLIRKSKCKFIASFDDDSWPNHPNFFKRAVEILQSHSAVSMIACKIIERDEIGKPLDEFPHLVTDHSYVGCGCVFRRTDLLETGSYVPLKHFYGMEELDMALRLLDQNRTLAYSSELEVFHDCGRAPKHRIAKNNASQITNTALLAFLRYPKRYWPYGLLQVGNRIKYCLVQKRLAGIIQGVLQIPFKCWRYRRYRKPIGAEAIRRFQHLSRNPPQRINPDDNRTPNTAEKSPTLEASRK